MLLSESWQLPVNLYKTQLLHLGTSINVHTYLVNGTTIKPVDKVLDLGIIKDNDLNYSSHISSMISKTRSRTGLIVWSFFLGQYFSSQASLHHICSSYTWICLTSLELICFKVYFSFRNVQKNFTYRIRSLKHLSYPELLAVLNHEPLNFRRLKADLVMYYKILNNLISINFNDHFTIRKSSSISTRSSGPCLLTPFCRTNRIPNNFFFRPINIWNTLPVTITNATSLFVFKRLLSNFDLSPFLFGHF